MKKLLLIGLMIVGCVLISSAQNRINGHEYVDLGLSVKWATCNVGADKPEEYGDYFAWGETRPKDDYIVVNSVTYDKYFGDIGGGRYDSANVNWGGSWRMPTYAEQNELREKCAWFWSSSNGVNGYVVKSKVNGNSIFLPAAGYRSGTSLNRVGSYGLYWSSTPSVVSNTTAYCVFFSKRSADGFRNARCNGRSVRPVTE